MKNRKTVVVAFLLVAAMLLSVGYAALTDVLTITGTATIDYAEAEDVFDADVYFSAAEATSSTGTGSTADTVGGVNTDDATFTVNKLALKGEQSVFTFTIKNASEVPAVISVAATKENGDPNPSNDKDGKFTVEYSYPDGMTVAADGTITVIVTVTVKDHIVEETTANFGIELTATAQEPTP